MMSDKYPYSVGEEPINSDWPKARTWDLLDDEGIITAGVDRLIRRLGLDRVEEEIQREKLRMFMKLPAAQPMPKRLREQVQQFIREGRTRDASS